MDILQPCLLMLLCAFHQGLSAVLSKPAEHQNLFTQRACCKRLSHFVYIGQDISGRPVNVDVGMCRSHCGGTPRTAHESGHQGYSKHTSMLEYLRSKKVKVRDPVNREITESLGHIPSCGRHHVCEPTGMRVERVLLFEGLREVEVIEECQCETKLSHCVRVPVLKTYFYETPYETVIDVGGCSRSKGFSEGFSCIPTKFDSALVETPNKVDLIHTVEACELKENCYRVPYLEYYYEIIDSEDGVKQERLKEIDVGRCLGSCTSGNRCLLRSPSDPQQCQLWADRAANSCVPQGNERHIFHDQHGELRTVLSITSCFCQP